MDSDPEIAWADLSWDPLAGCTRKSAACRHCYAEALTARFSRPGEWGHGFAEAGADGAAWTGQIGLVDDRLTLPLEIETPSRIFVNSLSDLFHESLPNETIDSIFAIMALEPRHVFQVLTKRPKTAQPYLSDPATPGRIERRMAEFGRTGDEATSIGCWPLPNVWLGVTAENQKEAARRIPLLLETPAAVRWIAAEPLLERIDVRSWLREPGVELEKRGPKLDWIVAGGEIGTEAQACHPDWARSLRDQCAQSGTPFFWTSWGAHTPPGEGRDEDESLPAEQVILSRSRSIDGLCHENYPAVPA